MQLLERDTAFEQLQDALNSVLGGDGQLVLVAGEAGLGKTALVQQFCRSVRDQAEVMVGACDPLSTPAPLGPLLDVAPHLGAEFQEQLRQPGPTRHLFGALVSKLSTGDGTRVLVFEDVHWADDATLDLLRFFPRRASATRALMLATYRDDELGPHHPLRIALGDLASSANLRRVSLQPLSLSAVAKMASRPTPVPLVEFEAWSRRRSTTMAPELCTDVQAHASGLLHPLLHQRLC